MQTESKRDRAVHWASRTSCLPTLAQAGFLSPPRSEAPMAFKSEHEDIREPQRGLSRVRDKPWRQRDTEWEPSRFREIDKSETESQRQIDKVRHGETPEKQRAQEWQRQWVGAGRAWHGAGLRASVCRSTSSGPTQRVHSTWKRWGRLLLNRPSQDALDTGMKESAGHYPIPWAHSPSPWFMPIFVPLYHLVGDQEIGTLSSSGLQAWNLVNERFPWAWCFSALLNHPHRVTPHRQAIFPKQHTCSGDSAGSVLSDPFPSGWPPLLSPYGNPLIPAAKSCPPG